jgi:hypothetical protein
MIKSMEDLRLFMLFLFMESLETESGGFLAFCMSVLTLLSIEDDLYRLRPSNFYPPEGFYPDGAYDAFWDRNQELFFKKFRFRLSHFHRMIKAMGLQDKELICDAKGHKFRADLCFLVVLRRLSYPCRFWEMTEDFGIPSNRLCEIFHSTIDLIYDHL